MVRDETPLREGRGLATCMFWAGPRDPLPACASACGTGELMASLESSRLDGQTEDVETEVPQCARWLYCGEPDDRQKAVLGKDCETRADARVALPSPPVWVALLPTSWSWDRVPAILPFLCHDFTSMQGHFTGHCPDLSFALFSLHGAEFSLFCQLMTFPQSFCDNFCPEATPYLPLYYWTRTSFSPPKSRTEAPLPSPRVPSPQCSSSPTTPCWFCSYLILGLHLQFSSPMGSCRIQATCASPCTTATTGETRG